MSDLNEKTNEAQKHEKLPTIYGLEITNKPFRVLGDAWDRYKSEFAFKEEQVFAKMEDGAFSVYDDEKKEYVPASYHNYDYFDVVTNDKSFRGRLVDPSSAPWDMGNFEVLTADGWVKVDYNEIVDGGGTAERVKKIKHVHYVPVSFQEGATITTKKGVKEVTRAKLELGTTAYEALLTIMGTFAKAKANPRDYWYSFTYIEEKKQYVIDQNNVLELTDEEKARAASEDAAATTSPLDALEPANEEDASFHNIFD